MYCYRQYPKPWIRKYHIPVSQQLEHSAYNRMVLGSIPIRDLLMKFRLFEEQLCTVENGCYLLCMAFHVLIFTNRNMYESVNVVENVNISPIYAPLHYAYQRNLFAICLTALGPKT